MAILTASFVSVDAFADITIMEWTANVSGGTVSGVARCGPKTGSTSKTSKNWVSTNWGLQNGGCYCRAQNLSDVSDWSSVSETYSTASAAGATTYWYGSGTNYSAGFDACAAGCADTCATAFENSATYQTDLCGGTCNVVNNTTEYTITYDNNGGSGCSSTTYTGTTTICTPTRDGYQFDGWMDVGTTDIYDGGDTVQGTSLNLEAQWSQIYTITYNNNGGSGCSNTNYTGTTTLCSPTLSGYSFDGWATTDGGSVVYAGGVSVSGGDLTLYAVWSEVVCNDCFCGDSPTPYPTEAVEGLTSWDDMVTAGTITGSGDLWAPSAETWDDYIDGQEWSVTFDNGIVHGYSACGSPNWTIAKSPYSTPFSTANAGCTCSLDGQNWYFAKKFTVGSDRATKTDYCRANCPAECAARFAADTGDLRTKMVDRYGECPVVASQSTPVQCSAGTYLPGGTSVCATCVAGNYCGGGTFTPGNNNQGMVSCAADIAANWTSASGASANTDCYYIVTLNKNGFSGTLSAGAGTGCRVVSTVDNTTNGELKLFYNTACTLPAINMTQSGWPNSTSWSATNEITDSVSSVIPATTTTPDVTTYYVRKTCAANYYKSAATTCSACGSNSSTPAENASLTCSCDTGYTANGTIGGAVVSTNGCLYAVGNNLHLHVEEKLYDMLTQRITTPSICIDVENTVYYVSLVPAEIENALAVEYNNKIYSGCDISNDYCIENGALYWADPNLYLQSTGGQHIDTGVVPDLDTAIEIEMADLSNLTYGLFGVKTGLLATSDVGFGISLSNGKFGFFRNGTSVSAITKDNNYHVYYLSNTDASIDGVPYNFASAASPIGSQRTMYMFGFNHNGTAVDKTIGVKYLKIWSGNTLVRHFVPVPAGLVIGNYTVPENGMFDLVTQTFYAATGGVGALQYGKVQ